MKDDNLCMFCLKISIYHEIQFCKKAFFIPLEEKLLVIKRKGLCHVCVVKDHLAEECLSNIKCPICFKRHLKFMCPNLEHNRSSEISRPDSNDEEKITDTLHSRVGTSNEVFLKNLVVMIKGKRAQRKARIILDTGSQKLCTKKSSAEVLGFDFQREEEFSHSLFGGKKTETQRHRCYKIYLDSLDGRYSCSLDSLDQDIICQGIASIRYGPWMSELNRKKIFVTDFQNILEPIDVLLGADVIGKLFTGEKEQLKSGLVAMKTKLGWTLMGKVPQLQHQRVNMATVSMLSQDLPVPFLWDLELLGIKDPVEQKTKEDQQKAVMVHFQDIVGKDSEGRYEVSCRRKDHSCLPNIYELSLKILESTYKKLEKMGYREKYLQVFEDRGRSD
nr:uncharacterized protein LOC107446958 [Parasteatoda tepidariorum]